MSKIIKLKSLIAKIATSNEKIGVCISFPSGKQEHWALYWYDEKDCQGEALLQRKKAGMKSDLQ